MWISRGSNPGEQSSQDDALSITPLPLGQKCYLLKYFLLRPLQHCIFEILCMSTRWFGFSVSTFHELSSTDEKNSWLSRDSNPGLLDGKQECYLCAKQPLKLSL